MIVDHLSHLKDYVKVNPYIGDVVEFLKHQDLNKLPLGRHEINENVFVIRESYDPKPETECYFEGHEQYADIQIVLSGKEAIGYRYKEISDDIVVKEAYLKEKDVAKYQISNFTAIHLSPGMFALVYPQDLHMPKLRVLDSSHVEKVVFKIKVK